MSHIIGSLINGIIGIYVGVNRCVYDARRWYTKDVRTWVTGDKFII